MNVRILVGVVIVALILSVVELSFVVREDEPGLSARVGWFPDVPEPGSPLDMDVDVSASPALTR